MDDLKAASKAHQYVEKIDCTEYFREALRKAYFCGYNAGHSDGRAEALTTRSPDPEENGRGA